MTPKEVIAKLERVQSKDESTKDDVNQALDTVIEQLRGEADSDFFFALEDLDAAIDNLGDKPLKMKLRKLFNAGDALLGKAEKAFLRISE